MRPEGEQAIRDAYRDATEYLSENDYPDLVKAIQDFGEIVLHECEIDAADFYEDDRVIWFGEIREVLAILRKLGEGEPK